MKKNKSFIISVVLGLCLFFIGKTILAATGVIEDTVPVNVGYVESNDAIAVRIIPNPEHLSIARWYQMKGFTGAPQALLVDGYEAIRDGRTVYVNAANIKGKEIFTNVYLISYNQDPSIKTIDILGQIVKNWKFNTDLKEIVSPSPRCEISLVTCEKDSDCPSSQFCLANDSSNTSLSMSHTCQLKTEKNCLIDADCPQNFFCNSVKAKIIRDIKRISKTEEIKQALKSYKDQNGYYPRLESGSYLSGQSVSVWPSWGESFLSEISLSKNFVDPINDLGYCSGFESKTCWNKDTKRFYSNLDGTLVLPPSSFAFIYKTDTKGLNYNLCSTMETRQPTAELSFNFSPQTTSNSNCVVSTGVVSGSSISNTAPRLVNSYLLGEADQSFNGSIEAYDDQRNPLTFKIESSINWEQAGWSAAPILKLSSNSNQRKVYAEKAGKPGVYPVTIIISDGQDKNNILSTSTNITIINSKSFIEAENIEYLLNPITPLNYTFYFTNPNIDDYETAATVTKVNGIGNFDLLSLEKSVEMVGSGRYKVSYKGLIPTTKEFISDSVYTYRVSVKDKFKEVTSKDFKITIKSEGPSLNFNCAGFNRSSNSYSCLLGPLEQAGQKLSYSNNNLNFAGLKIFTSGANAYLNSVSTDFDSAHSSSVIDIKAKNQYGASTTKSFKLEIQTFCGDGVKQEQNSERRGGIYNNGQEDCDGAEGVALNAETSSETAQYACATFSRNTPNPITNNNYCVFKSPVDGGGFCGDTYCQVKHENKDNCPQDCMSICVPNCSKLGHDCGDNGCGGSCGDCAIGDECFGGKCCLNEGTFSVVGGSGTTAQKVYLNEKLIDSSKLTPFVGKILHGKNVLAIQVTDSKLSQIKATIKQVSQVVDKNNIPKNTCRNLSTSNLKNWKCSNTALNYTEGEKQYSWFSLDYNEKNWILPNSGFNDGYGTVWALDYSPVNSDGKCADDNCNQLKTTTCRYTFFGDATSTESCDPDSSTKECGSNGCGGNFRPDNCAAAKHKNNNFYCGSDNKCTCDKLTCDQAGIAKGSEGSRCGIIDDRCNSKIDCGAACGEGLYCKLPKDKENAKTDYTCQKKCWYKTVVTASMDIRQGDEPEPTKCAVKKLNDDPHCNNYNPPTCPTDCPTRKIISTGLKNDSCYEWKHILWSLIDYKVFKERYKYRCEKKESDWVCYGDLCPNGNIDNNGDCTCKPKCDANSCGDDSCGGVCNEGDCAQGTVCGDNGKCQPCTASCDYENSCGGSDKCNGICTNGTCPLTLKGQQSICENSTCVCKPDCTGKACGADDGCGGKCYNIENTCANTNQSCLTGGCKDNIGACESELDNIESQEACWSKQSEGTCPLNTTDKCFWSDSVGCDSLNISLTSQRYCGKILTRSVCQNAVKIHKCRWMTLGYCTNPKKESDCKSNLTYGSCVTNHIDTGCLWAFR